MMLCVKTCNSLNNFISQHILRLFSHELHDLCADNDVSCAHAQKLQPVVFFHMVLDSFQTLH
jgi:hypothetical protein